MKKLNVLLNRGVHLARPTRRTRKFVPGTIWLRCWPTLD